MAQITARCDHCGVYFSASRSTARYCSHAHRLAAHQARAARRQATMAELFEAQTRALQARDAATLADVQGRAVAFLGLVPA